MASKSDAPVSRQAEREDPRSFDGAYRRNSPPPQDPDDDDPKSSGFLNEGDGPLPEQDPTRVSDN